jgi:hypothetical protein
MTHGLILTPANKYRKELTFVYSTILIDIIIAKGEANRCALGHYGLKLAVRF